METEDSPLWVSNAHLLVHFQVHTGQVKFNQATNRWQHIPDHDLEVQFNFPQAANWIAAALRCLGKCLGLKVQAQSRIPDGGTYRCWTPCLLVKMQRNAFEKIERLLQGRGVTGVTSVRQSFGGVASFHCGS